MRFIISRAVLTSLNGLSIFTFHFAMLAILLAIITGDAPAQDKARTVLLTWIRDNEGEYDCEGTEKTVVNLRLDRTRGIDPGFNMERIEDADLKRLELMPDIRELTLENRHALTDECVPHIAQLKRLRKLNLSHTRISGHSLNLLAQLPLLHDLNLNRCPNVGDEAAKAIKQLKKLTSLSANGSPNGGMHEDAWRSLILQELRLNNLPPSSMGVYSPSPKKRLDELRAGMTNVGLKHIAELSELRSLSLAHTKIDDDGLEALAQLPHLTKLNLSGTDVTDKGMVHIGRLSKLRSLTLNVTFLTDLGLESLSQLAELEELAIRSTAISGKGLQKLHSCTKLRRLDVSGTYLPDDAIEALQGFQRLDELIIRSTKISFPALVKLSRAVPSLSLKKTLIASDIGTTPFTVWPPPTNDAEPALVCLNLNAQPTGPNETTSVIKDDDLRFLSRERLLDRLKFLYLNNSQVTNAGIETLDGIESLQILCIDNTPVTDAGLAHLRKSKELQTLAIRNTRISLGGIVQLIVREQNRTLEDALRVAGLVLSPTADGQALSLDLHAARIIDADIETVAQLDQLDTLLLQDNAISDVGLARLAQFKSLRQLWVSGNLISGQGLASLKRLPSLETLWLTDTQAVESDLLHLVDLPRLQILNVSGMTFTAKGADYIKALESLETLIIDSAALKTIDLEEIQKVNPKITIIFSQKKALAAIRVRERREVILPQGFHRVIEMGGVETEVMKTPLVSVFGDAHFEQANSFYLRKNATHFPNHWKELATLKTLNLFRAQVNQDDLSELGNLPMLSVLRLGESSVSDADLAPIGKLSGLQELDLSGTKISDAGMVHLQRLEKLERLNLRGVFIDEGIRHLSQLHSLRELDLHETLTTDESLKHLYKLTKLERINIESTYVSVEGVNQLRKQLPNAKVECGSILSDERKLASYFGRLRIPMSRDSEDQVFLVDLRSRDDIPSLIPQLLKLKNLRGVYLGKQATKSILDEILGISSLELLDLSDCELTEIGIVNLHRLQRLNTLYLNRNTVSNDTLESLQSLPQLRILWLAGSKFPDGISKLGRLTKLEDLGLNSTAILDEELAQLTQLPKLSSIFLDSTQISKAALVHLVKMSRLEELSLRNTALSKGDLTDFRTMHPQCAVYLGE